jgi:hypothetical protein
MGGGPDDTRPPRDESRHCGVSHRLLRNIVETTLLSPSSTLEPSVAATAAALSNAARAEGSRGLAGPYSDAGPIFIDPGVARAHEVGSTP